MTDVVDIRTVNEILDQIYQILAGKGPDIQGVVIADLSATWLAGHGILDDPEASRKLRYDILKEHIEIVRQLTELYAPDALALAKSLRKH